MKINIYYGGRGLIDDPTLYVINKMQAVLEEINVTVERFNLHELKNTITTLPQTLKSADGVILATTVEWYGIGGFMQQFLDACWLYGDKEKISKIYMCPIVMATTYGEREGKLDLSNAWEILGGLPCSGICGYITESLTLEMNESYKVLIEKKAENMYRTINQKIPSLPASNQAVKQMVATHQLELSPQESEQLSQYVSDDIYVQRQKEDIQELATFFRGKMDEQETEKDYIQILRKAFHPQAGIKASYRIQIDSEKNPISLKVDGNNLDVRFGQIDDPDVALSISRKTLEEIFRSKMTFQRAFMTGEIISKGDFKVLRMLDQFLIFPER